MWYILVDASDNVMKKYVDPISCSPKDRTNLLKVQNWPNGKRKSEVKLKKEKKNVTESGVSVEVDGDLIDKIKV